MNGINNLRLIDAGYSMFSCRSMLAKAVNRRLISNR